MRSCQRPTPAWHYNIFDICNIQYLLISLYIFQNTPIFFRTFNGVLRHFATFQRKIECIETLMEVFVDHDWSGDVDREVEAIC